MNFPIVGVGASAGGLESFIQLLNGVPEDAGLAIVFIQHLDPSHPSLSTEIFSKATKMPVAEARDRTVVQINHVYLLPPSFDMTIKSGTLFLQPRVDSAAIHKPVDTFLESLALDEGTKSVGVVLSGTASDGTEGLRSIKTEGGVTLVQTIESAKFGGMPLAAIQAKVADLVLDPKSIAIEIVRIARQHSANLKIEKSQEPDLDAALNDIINILWRQTHVNFTDYKKTTLRRRIARRMMVHRQSTEKLYADFLRGNRDEVQTLLAEILIHVTSFFRDPEEFEELKKDVFPKIVAAHQNGTPIRVWIAGCSTGEEAYSILIALLEFIGPNITSHSIQMFASDISESAIRKARDGFYPNSLVQNIPPILLARYFTAFPGGYKVNKSLRELCLFSKHDVTADPPFAKVDLISCRNLLIYFNEALQNDVFPIFHYALNAGGFLFLGQSESVGSFNHVFAALDQNHKIYKKLPACKGLPKLRFSPNFSSEETSRTPKSQRAFAVFDLQKIANQIVALKYGPSGVIFNEANEIISFRGRTVPYLEQLTGHASLQLFKLLHPDLVKDVKNLIQAVKTNFTAIRKEDVAYGPAGQTDHINIEVIPINPTAPDEERMYLLLFERPQKSQGDFAPLPQFAEADPQKSKSLQMDFSITDQRIQQLELQLASALEEHEFLEVDHDTFQNEVGAATEELQSTNEELQSTNEELETAQEELQSTNQELTTVNDQLQHRNSELGELNNDLVNLLSSIELPIIIVGPRHKIRRFTSSATRVLKLAASDIGRPILDIPSNLKLNDLDVLISKVMETLTISETEVQDQSGHWYRLQIRPYRTTDNRIDGAVLSFIDIEVLKQAVDRLNMALNQATSIADALQIPSVIIDRNLKIRNVSQLFCKIFGVNAKETEGQLLTELGNKNWDVSILKSRLEQTILLKKPFQEFEVSGEFLGIGHRTYLLNAREIQWVDHAETEPKSILITFFDITERKQTELRLEESEITHRTILESAHDGIVSISAAGLIKTANSQTERWFGYQPGEMIGIKFDQLIPLASRRLHKKLHADYLQAPAARVMGESLDLFGQRKDETTFPIEISLSPVTTKSGKIIIAVLRDVSTRRQADEERNILLKKAEEDRAEAEKANRAKDLFLATLSHELRTPLSSILTWAQLIRHGKVDFEKAKAGAVVIENSAKAQSQLIDDLLDISRIIAGKLAVEITAVDLRSVIPHAVDSVRSLAEKKSIKFDLRISEEPGIILANAGRLQQIICNLLTNAIKFSAKKSTIEIHLDYITEQKRRFVQLQVIDHGKGIPEEFLPMIFSRFTQADSTSTRVHGGLGLGLSIVSSLVALQGGTVTAANAVQGTGAIFTVTFPLTLQTTIVQSDGTELSSDNSNATPIKSSEIPSLEGYDVLIVDDDDGARDSLSIYLRSFGAVIVGADSAAKALEALTKSSFDLIISDIAMPVVDGYSLLRSIRRLKPEEGANTPAIALTAFATDADAKMAVEAGFQAHFAKPIEANELARAVSKYAIKKILA